MNKYILPSVAACLMVSQVSLAATVPSNIAALREQLKAAAKKVTKEVFSNQSGSVKIPSNAKISYVSHTRAPNGKLEIADYVEDDVYSFSLPKVCDAVWEYKPHGGSSIVKLRCPNSYGFSKFEWWYGSGYPSETIDDLHGTYPSDSEWHTIEVKHSPHESSRIWTNINIIPLF